ncbi:MAG: hypothetical protein EOP06_32135 [Proteobacteria bacterium]|nr:MAG: hypothetical protein EOP06_32135 [Pseudomonadota bacterium]
MKNFMTKNIKTGFLGLIAATALLSACQKSGGGGAAAVPPPVAYNCQYPNMGCNGIGGVGGGQILYSGSTTQNGMQQAQFQVSSQGLGSGIGSIQGTLSITNQYGYICQNFMLPPQVPMTFSSQQPGQIVAGDAFDGVVMVQLPQGMPVQARVQVIPVRQGLPGMFGIVISGCQEMIMNF